MSIESDAERNVTINSRKFDGKIHRSWKAKLIEKGVTLLTFVGKFEKEIEHEHLGVIRRGTISYEYYWLNKGYNVFRFHEPEGGLRNFYCNLNLPPLFENDILDYVDLDIDVLVWKDFTCRILDLEEFRENAEIFKYPEIIHEDIDRNLKELLLLIKNRSFPFNFQNFIT